MNWYEFLNKSDEWAERLDNGLNMSFILLLLLFVIGATALVTFAMYISEWMDKPKGGK